MKKIALTTLLLAGLCSSLSAQPPVTSGLNLYLDGATGYNPNGPLPSVWRDLSGSGNDVTALNPTSAEPTWISTTSGYTGVQFDGIANVMTRPANSTNGLTNPNATIFIVRIGNTAYNTMAGPYSTIWPTTVAIGQNDTWDNDFSMMGDWVVHSSTSGNWVHRDHPCYHKLSDCSPAVLTGVLRTGISSADLDYYVNGVISTNPIFTQGSPTPFTSAERGIAVGATWSSSPGVIHPNTYFQGILLEVLAYNRVLSNAEIASVNAYLMHKYNAHDVCNDFDGCDANFTWCAGTASPNNYTFTAQTAGQPYNYEWTVNGAVAGTGSTLNYTFAPGSTDNVCLNLTDCDGKVRCSKCINLCHGDNPKQAMAKLPADQDVQLVSVVPNPATDMVTVQLSGASAEPLQLQVTDMAGRAVYTTTTTAATGKIDVPLQGFATGMYIVQLQGKTIQLSAKFVKK